MSTEIAESRPGSRMRHRKILRREGFPPLPVPLTSSQVQLPPGARAGGSPEKLLLPGHAEVPGGAGIRGVRQAGRQEEARLTCLLVEDAKSDETSRCARLCPAALAPLMSSSHPLELQGGEALAPSRPAGKKSMAEEEKFWMDLEAAGGQRLCDVVR